MSNSDFGIGFLVGVVTIVVIIGIFVIGFEQGRKNCPVCANAKALAEVKK